MKIKKTMKLDGKWNLIFGWYYEVSTYRLLFTIGVFKITALPPEGGVITPENYKGFWITKPLKTWLIERHIE